MVNDTAFKTNVQWQELLLVSQDSIIAFLRKEEPKPEDLAKVRVATSALASYTRHESTDSARQATAVAIARELATNREEFLLYLKASSPTLQSLPSPTKEQEQP